MNLNQLSSIAIARPLAGLSSPDSDASQPLVRILSLSGGGARGIFQATFLRKLGPQLGGSLSSHFEIVAGTSTGAIIAAAVVCGLEMAKVEELYKNRGPLIFAGRTLSGFRRGARYNQQVLRESLAAVFGDRRLGELKKPTLLVPATTLDTFKPRLFSNVQESDRDLRLVDVLLASAAAPTYFDPVTPESEARSYVDGGLWMNSPSLLAIIHAGVLRDNHNGRLRLLSVGNGRNAQGQLRETFMRQRTYSRFMVSCILDMMFEAQTSYADMMARSMLGKERVIDVNYEVPGPRIELDDMRAALQRLPPLAEDRANNMAPDIEKLLSASTGMRRLAEVEGMMLGALGAVSDTLTPSAATGVGMLGGLAAGSAPPTRPAATSEET